jgi:transcriptional/translational regulatory protein YebC/TACO1
MRIWTTGVSVIIEVATDNKNRGNCGSPFPFYKVWGNLGSKFCLMDFCSLGSNLVSTNGKSEDEMLEAILEAGASDMEYDEEQTRIFVQSRIYGAVNKYLQEHKFNILESKLEIYSKYLY